jgi:hypothetical protein
MQNFNCESEPTVVVSLELFIVAHCRFQYTTPITRHGGLHLSPAAIEFIDAHVSSLTSSQIYSEPLAASGAGHLVLNDSNLGVASSF